jgi:endoglucanase
MKKMSLLFMLMITSLGFGQNLITNGDFESGAAGWSGNAVNVVTEGGNSYNSANVIAPGNPWDKNLSYVTPITTSGTAYKLTFQAWSDTNRPLIAGIGLNQDPWSSDVQTVNLTTTAQTFVLNLTANFANANSRIIFDMGNAVGFVGIDNVVLEQVTTTCNNGVQDGDETGVDCGGSCAPCVATPLVAAPTPPGRPTADVKSIFSDAYAPIATLNYLGVDNQPSNDDTFNTSWCPGTTSLIQVAGNNTNKITGLGCEGISFKSGRFDATDFTHVHMDIWTPTATMDKSFNIKFSNWNGGAGEANAIEYSINNSNLLPSTNPGTWISLDIPLSSFAGANRNDLVQFVITSDLGTVYYDNLYLHKNTLGVNDANTSKVVRIYPNPVKAGEMITADANVKNIEVFSMTGQKVKSADAKSISSQGLAKGIYMIKTTNEKGETQSSKLIVK